MKKAVMNSLIFIFIALLGISILFFSGCETMPAQPRKTSLELQAIQAKEFETEKRVAFAAVMSVFQDIGYVVSSADFDTGFITAKSPSQSTNVHSFDIKAFFEIIGTTQIFTSATAFIEQMRQGTSKIRLNFVKVRITSSAHGRQGRNDTPIEDPLLYQNAFVKIQEAIFIRSMSK